jgi:hypothetical protein
MNSFWSSAFSQFKNCGHNAHVFFFLGVVGLAGVLAAGVLIVQFREYVLPALTAGLLFVAGRRLLAARRTRMRRHSQAPLSPLSEDELRAARSKLQARR